MADHPHRVIRVAPESGVHLVNGRPDAFVNLLSSTLIDQHVAEEAGHRGSLLRT
jgi:hypothetical protein